MCKVYTGFHGTSEIQHGLCACTVNNPLAKARVLSPRTGAQTMLHLSHNSYHTYNKPLDTFPHTRAMKSMQSQIRLFRKELSDTSKVLHCWTVLQ